MRRDPKQYAPRQAPTTVNVTAEIVASTIYDFGAVYWDVPISDEEIFSTVVGRAFTLPVDCDGSYCVANTAATAETVLSIQKNAVEVGTITFAIAGDTGTFSMASAQAFAPGDILSVYAPTVPDATIAGIKFTFLGSRA